MQLVRVNDDTGAASQFFSWLDVDQSSGHVAVSWYDARNDAAGNDDVQYFMAFSTNGGATWSDNFQISNGTSNAAAAGSFNLGDYTGLAYEDGVIHMVWADNSNSTGDNPAGALSAMDTYYDRILPRATYLGMETHVDDVHLIGVDEFELFVSGTVKLNKASGSDGSSLKRRMNWEAATVTNDPTDRLADLDIASAIQLQIFDASAGLDIDGFFVAFAEHVTINFATVTVDDGPGGAPRLTDADVILIDVPNAAIFAGSGGGLRADHTGLADIDDDDVGFRATGVHFSMVLARGASDDPVATNRGDTYVGIEAGITNAQLVGIEDVELFASGTLRLNWATDASGARLTPRMNWTAATGAANDPAGLLADLTIVSAVELQVVDGHVGLNIAGVVVADTGEVTITRATATVTDGTVTLPDATVLSIDAQDAGVFAGSGGFLDAVTHTLNRDAIRASTTAIGFLATDVDFNFVLASGAAIDFDVNVTRFLADQSEVAIAVNPNDSNDIVVAPIDDDPLAGVFGMLSSNDHVWVSHNGGRTFDRKLILLPAGATASHGDPTVAWGRDNRVVYVHMVDKPGGGAHGSRTDVHVMASAVSLDGGLNWLAENTGVIGSLALREADGNGFIDAFPDNNDKEFIAVGPDFANPSQDRYAVAWQRNGVIFASTSTDGIGWSHPVQVSNRDDDATTHRPTGNAIDSIPTFGPNGEIYVVWEEYGESGVSKIMFDVSYDGGLTWDVGAPGVLTAFPGLDTSVSTLEPPDTHLAAGPGHLVEVVNDAIAVFDKTSGARLFMQPLGDFFDDLALDGSTIFDPVVTYDELIGRFVVLAIEGSTPGNHVLYAVSDASNPLLDLGGDGNPFSEMHRLQIDATLWSDYPKVGWNDDIHVFTFNMFNGADVFQRADLLIVDKSMVTDRNAGTFASSVVNRLATDFTLAPATMHGAAANDPMWFVERTDGGSMVRLVRLDNALTAPAFTQFDIDVNDYAAVPAALQPL
ncbi:MAG TPA: sialidase family protein, partial [Ilumatobacter sp.]|nr:sialidase family protein [Ilumatobacter sp.]